MVPPAYGLKPAACVLRRAGCVDASTGKRRSSWARKSLARSATLANVQKPLDFSAAFADITHRIRGIRRPKEIVGYGMAENMNTLRGAVRSR